MAWKPTAAHPSRGNHRPRGSAPRSRRRVCLSAAVLALALPASPAAAYGGGGETEPVAPAAGAVPVSPLPSSFPLPQVTPPVSDVGGDALVALAARAGATEAQLRYEGAAAAAAAWDSAAARATSAEAAAARLDRAAATLLDRLSVAGSTAAGSRAADSAGEAVVIASRAAAAVWTEITAEPTPPLPSGTDDAVVRQVSTSTGSWLPERNLVASMSTRARGLSAEAAAIRSFIGPRPDDGVVAFAYVVAQAVADDALRAVAVAVAGRPGRDADGLAAAWAQLSPTRFSAVMVALAQVGKPYVFDSDGPDSFDCSGFTSYVWWVAARYHIPSYSFSQQDALPAVAEEELVAGDLVFWDRSAVVEPGRSPGHVAMVLGWENFIVEAHGSGSVRVARYKDAFRSGFARVPVL